MDRAAALALDGADPLASFRSEFVITETGLIYLDGNSLGRLPARTAARLAAVIEEEWGAGLVRSWHHWLDLSTETGDTLAPLIGARPGETLVADQTSINLFKLAEAALDFSGRTDIVTDTGNFPSDRYVLSAVAERRGGRVTVIEADPIAGPSAGDVAAVLSNSVGLVSLSHVGYRTGTVLDLPGITAASHDHGALCLWDLSHSVGAVPVDLAAAGADLAVGCTYKHLNGGPGAPAFLWVRTDLQARLEQPIKGWFGHDDMFAFAPEYRPAAGIRRFAVGTPPILSLTAARCGIELTLEAGIEAIQSKSQALTELIVDRFDALLVGLGFGLGSPRDPDRRGGHVALLHPDAGRITRALIDRRVLPDFRHPDTIRLGVAPLYTTFTEVWDAIEILASIVANGDHERYTPERSRVT